MNEVDVGIASAQDFSKPEKKVERIELTRFQRTRFLDKDAATQRIIELEDENERCRKLMLQAEIWLGVHHGDCSCTAKGLVARIHEALGGNDA